MGKRLVGRRIGTSSAQLLDDRARHDIQSRPRPPARADKPDIRSIRATASGGHQEDVMAARSIASLTLSFGLVSIPVKLYSATESASGVGFNLLTPEGGRVKQQYISEATGAVVARADMKKGYEFEKGQFVVFTPEELKALEEGASHVVEIVSKSVDPLYYDKAYFIAPDKRGANPTACSSWPCGKASAARSQSGRTKGKARNQCSHYPVHIGAGDEARAGLVQT